MNSLLSSLAERVLFGSHPGTDMLQVAAQKLLGGPRPASFSLDGHEFNCLTSHKYFFERDRYESDLWKVLDGSILQSDIVFDVGAHFGFWMVRLHSRCTHVYGFEPSSSNRAFLTRNIAGLSNVEVVPAAVGDKNGTIQFSEVGSMSRTGVGDTVVESVTLDSFSQSNRFPTVLLIDIEGNAGKALAGAAEVLIRRPTVIVEIHNPEEERSVVSALSNYKLDFPNNRKYPFHLFANITRGEQA